MLSEKKLKNSMKINTEIDIAGIRMKNPVMPASGTFGYGREYSEFFDLNRLGALVTKAVTLEPREGNPPHRICETPSGMLNSIGLQNPGYKHFLKEAIPFLAKYDVPVIVNISERTIDDYVKIAEILSDVWRINGLELNISCPNVKQGGMVFGTDAQATYEVTSRVKKVTAAAGKPLIVKLTPNVTNIVEIAKAAKEAGADALSMINTLRGMAIDIEKREPRIHGGGMYSGGLSGPCIRPVGVYCVRQVYKANLGLPIIGMGGILDGRDAIEYILAGANAVAAGTATFANPFAMLETIKGIKDYMKKHKVKDIKSLVGQMKEI